MHDELRRLDDDLAAGRLDADSYRRRRDDLLATRQPGPPPSPPVAEAATPAEAVEPHAVEIGAVEPRAVEPRAVESAGPRPSANGTDRVGAAGSRPDEVSTDEVPTDEVDAVATGRDEVAADDPATSEPPPDLVPGPAGDVRDPFPPPFRWDGGGADVVADATQVVAASSAAGDAPERTQVVRSAPDGGPPPGAADATQVVERSGARVPDPRRGSWRAGPLAPPPAPERTQFVPGAALTRAGDLRAVPARRTVPPWVDERSVVPADARRPGRELFARRRGPSPAAVIGTAALVLVVLVVLTLSFLLG